jgi:hypothetical protein
VQPNTDSEVQRHSQKLVRVSELPVVWSLAHGRPQPTTVVETQPRWAIWSLGSRNGLSFISCRAWIISISTTTRLSILHTAQEKSPLRAIAQECPGFVSLHPWPAKICNNHRPNQKNPGERSSHYAAAANLMQRVVSTACIVELE